MGTTCKHCGAGFEADCGCGLVVAHVEGKPTTRGELLAMFNRISMRSNWKGPLFGWVAEKELALAEAAAEFFAGSPLEVQQREAGKVYVRGAGYYECIGA